jgi:hypothetical protein
VRLLTTEGERESVSALGDEVKKVGVSWDLVALRGKDITLEIRDDDYKANDYIGVSGFDLITECNGL